MTTSSEAYSKQTLCSLWTTYQGRLDSERHRDKALRERRDHRHTEQLISFYTKFPLMYKEALEASGMTAETES